ncbi:MAG TPA: VWA domain-containing protein [Bryobacteraceae bacterium]
MKFSYFASTPRRPRPRIRLARIGLLLTGPGLACSPIILGQTTIQTNVKQVLVPVVVTDKAGYHITGMHASDFRITEDGIPQDIVSISTSTAENQLPDAPDARTPPASSASSASTLSSAASSPKRTYLICIDALHSTFSNFGRVRQALKNFFDDEKAGDSQYALIALGRQAQVIQDSTRDPAAVLATITSKNFTKTIIDSESAKLANDIQEFTYFMRDFYCTHCACEAFNTPERPGCPVQQARLQGYLLRSGERTRFLDENFYRALQQIVTATGTMPTTRTILFISDGFNRFPGRELYAVMNGFAPKDHRFEFNPRDTNDRLQNILKIAVNQNIRFYTIDSRGLYTGGSLGGSTFDASTGLGASIPQTVDLNRMTVAHQNTDVLAALARQTGGLFFENNNDLLKGIRRAFADGREYYVLAYVPKNKSDDGTFRHIAVEIKNKKLHVNAKAGYWAPTQ